MLCRKPVRLGVIALCGLLSVPGRSATSEASALATAQLHLSAVFTVQRFAYFLYNFGPSPHSGVIAPLNPQPIGPLRYLPDGSRIQHARTTDGTEIEYTFYNGATSAEVTYPDGRHESIRRVTGVLGDVTEHVLSSGERARYVVKPRQNPNDPVHSITEGEVDLADGSRQPFRVLTLVLILQPHDLDILDAAIPGGERLHWELPVTDAAHPPADVPIPTLSASGTYVVPGRRLDFSLVGSPGSAQYDHWSFHGARRLVGAFRLQPDFSGAGQVLQSRNLLFVQQWNRGARGPVQIADGQAALAGPSAGAQAFGNATFSKAIIDNAPSPGQ